MKIDKIFVDHVVEDEGDRNFLAGMISMIRSRDKTIVVEGVESQGQVEVLKSLKADKIQGYYFSKPVSPEKFEQLLRTGALLPLSAK